MSITSSEAFNEVLNEDEYFEAVKRRLGVDTLSNGKRETVRENHKAGYSIKETATQLDLV